MKAIDGPSRYGSTSSIVVEFGTGPGALHRNRAARLASLLLSLQPAYAAERMDGLPTLAPPAGDASPGALLAHAALVLQRWGGYPVLNSTARTSARKGVETVAYQFCAPHIGAAAGSVAAMLALYASVGRAASLRADHARLLEQFLAEHVDKPLAVAAFIRDAAARGIPWRAVANADEFLDLGQGRKQRRVWRNLTGATGNIGSLLTTRKDHANTVFHAHGLPVPRQRKVDSADTAVRALRLIGPPVVVKPVSRDFGTAVQVGLETEAEVRRAFAVAREHGRVLVEEQIAGDHHRIMIINGRVTSVRRQLPARVTGDGVRTVRYLVAEANRTRAANGWKLIPLDAESDLVLARQGQRPDSVPPAGVEVRLRTQANLSTGGTMEVMTDRVHPDNARMALRAAAVIGIDVAGLDFITPDITRSYLEVGGGICEINIAPGFIFDEQRLLLDEWFPKGDDGRIPVVAILEPGESGHLARCAVALLEKRGGPVCRASRSGVRIGEAEIIRADIESARGALIAVSEPSAAGAVIELDAASVLEDGLGIDRCTVLLAPPSGAPERDEALQLLTSVAGSTLEAKESAPAACPVCGTQSPGAESELLRALKAKL